MKPRSGVSITTIRFDPLPAEREAFRRFCDRLIFEDWEQPDFPLRLNAELQLADLQGADFFGNARLFLAALAEEDGTPATVTGNLNRAFVRRMFDRLRLPAPYRDSAIRVCKLFNEEEVWPLHLVRVVCRCAGLVARRKKRIGLTKAGRALLPDDQAGVLFRRLFLAYFQRFDLAHDCPYRVVPAIQDTVGIVLWRLHRVAREWTPVKGLAPQILLPAVLDQLRQAMVSPHDTEEWILASYVLNPLLRLGLIDLQKDDDFAVVSKDNSIRISALWKSFIGFVDYE